jgi:hypothetical protein
MKLHYGGQRSGTQCRRLKADDLVFVVGGRGPGPREPGRESQGPGARVERYVQSKNLLCRQQILPAPMANI